MEVESIAFGAVFGCLLVIVVCCYGGACYMKQLRQSDMRGGVNNLTTI